MKINIAFYIVLLVVSILALPLVQIADPSLLMVVAKPSYKNKMNVNELMTRIEFKNKNTIIFKDSVVGRANVFTVSANSYNKIHNVMASAIGKKLDTESVARVENYIKFLLKKEEIITSQGNSLPHDFTDEVIIVMINEGVSKFPNQPTHLLVDLRGSRP